MDRIQVVGAVIVEGHRCLVAQRGARMSAPFAWEFPGGKIEEGETAEGALAREIWEELNLEISVGEKLGRAEVEVAGRVVVLEVFAASIVGGSLFLHEHASVRWVSGDELPLLEWAPADVPLIGAVAAFLVRPR